MTTYTGQSPIVGPSTPIDIDLLILWAVKNGAHRTEELEAYFSALKSGSNTLGLDFGVLAAQWDLETDTGRSPWWRDGLNPAGLGITGDPAQNAKAQTWNTGEVAALGHLAHMVAYVYGANWWEVWPTSWPEPDEFDRRFFLVPRTGPKKPARTLEDLNQTWAIDAQNNYHGKLASRANRIVEVAGKPDVSIPDGEEDIPATFSGWLDLMFGKGRWSITQDWAARGGPDLYAYGKGHGLDGSQHTGVDVGMAYGTPMHAPSRGLIVCAGTGRGDGVNGNGCSAYRDWGDGGEGSGTKGVGRIEIYYPAMNASLIYGHSRTCTVKPGDTVDRGQSLGTSGGMFGPHIHLEAIQWGTAQGWTLIDPRSLLAKFGKAPAPEPEEPEPMAKPKFLVIAGHRTIDESEAREEAQRTPAIADTYVKVLRSMGFDVDRLPDETYQSLSDVGRACHDWMQRTPGDLVMIDCHFEDGHPARGLFAIIPNRDNLRPAPNIPQAEDDTWENNIEDRRVGGAIARALSAHTGIPLRQTTQPGLMDETRTGVASDGWRLGMFAYTSPFYARSVRLVVEHGNLGAAQDREVIRSGSYLAKIESGLREAFSQLYGATQPTPAPEPPGDYAPPISVPELAAMANADPDTVAAIVTDEGTNYIYVNDRVRAIRDTPRLQRANAGAQRVGPHVRKGQDFTVSWLFTANDKRTYYLTPAFTRILASDTERISDAIGGG